MLKLQQTSSEKDSQISHLQQQVTNLQSTATKSVPCICGRNSDKCQADGLSHICICSNKDSTKLCRCVNQHKCICSEEEPRWCISEHHNCVCSNPPVSEGYGDMAKYFISSCRAHTNCTCDFRETSPSCQADDDHRCICSNYNFNKECKSREHFYFCGSLLSNKDRALCRSNVNHECNVYIPYINNIMII